MTQKVLAFNRVTIYIGLEIFTLSFLRTLKNTKQKTVD